ncbi:MAG TPA: ABC transporter substrate-binding protein [Chloroflexota bacterium]|nr:ABC transporter substrate-binding protein [Chloroflexota bacterium]
MVRAGLVLLVAVWSAACAAAPTAAPAGAALTATAARAAGAAGPAAAPSSRPEPAPPFAVAPRPIHISITSEGLQFLPLRIAVTEGFFARHGLDATLHRIDANAGLAGLLAGQFDYLASFSRVINSNMHGIPVRFVAALVDRPMHVLIARPEYPTLADLRGKNIGTSSPGGVEDFIVRTILRANGLDPDRDANLYPAGQGGVAALEAGQLDAIGLQPPQSTELERRGYHVVGRAAALLPDLALTATATTAERVANDPAGVAAFAAGYLEALRYLHADRAGAARVAAAWLDLSPDVALAAYDEAIDSFSADGSFSEATLRRGVEIEREKDPTLTWDRPVADMVAGDLLLEVQRTLGLVAP